MSPSSEPPRGPTPGRVAASPSSVSQLPQHGLFTIEEREDLGCLLFPDVSPRLRLLDCGLGLPCAPERHAEQLGPVALRPAPSLRQIQSYRLARPLGLIGEVPVELSHPLDDRSHRARDLDRNVVGIEP